MNAKLNPSEYSLVAAHLVRLAPLIRSRLDSGQVSLNDLAANAYWLAWASHYTAETADRDCAGHWIKVAHHYLLKHEILLTNMLTHPISTWFFLHLWNLSFPQEQLELPNLAAEITDEKIEAFVQSREHDLVGGVTGLGVILSLVGKPSHVIDSLNRQLVHNPNYWSYPLSSRRITPWAERPHPPEATDLGVSHGITGPYLLALWLGEKELSQKLQQALIIAAQETPAELPYPAYLGAPAHISHDKIHRQCAWCYGDPTTGFALLLAGEETKQLGLTLLEKGMARAHSLPDHHLCHGQSGVAQVAWRAYLLSGELTLKSQVIDWLQRLPTDCSQWIRTESRNQSDILGGELGTGYVLLSLIRPELQWDRLFLLQGGTP